MLAARQSTGLCLCVHACNALYANVSSVYPACVMAIWFALPIQRHSKLQLCGFGTFEVGLYRSFATEYSFIHSFISSEFVSISLLFVQIPAWLLLHFPIWGQHECYAITWHMYLYFSSCHVALPSHLQSRLVVKSEVKRTFGKLRRRSERNI